MGWRPPSQEGSNLTQKVLTHSLAKQLLVLLLDLLILLVAWRLAFHSLRISSSQGRVLFFMQNSKVDGANLMGGRTQESDARIEVCG
ncbi:hypothetical protein POPTR_015G023750v4 [Populus trichocarpa]|uniref:Uncharacterized protein n=1 Tax=Populus trichocarpa TaxID=3694 RepID=A0ACC0RUD3_POPTR|nr:hypothetical protein POPTR_015G023750v4 [Populus trichocarpa]